MLEGLTVWQMLAAIGGAVVVADRVLAALVRLGLVPAKFVRWWQQRWAERTHQRELEAARDKKIDEVLAEFRPNGGDSMRDRINVVSSMQEQMAVEVGTLTRNLDKVQSQGHDQAILLASHMERSEGTHARIVKKVDEIAERERQAHPELLADHIEQSERTHDELTGKVDHIVEHLDRSSGDNHEGEEA